MKRNHLKLLDLDSFSTDAKKCLSPVQKKISLYYINSNIKAIKSHIKNFNITNPSKKYKNLETIETNSRFKKYMDKYYAYKQYIKEKDKHNIKKRTKSTIDLLVDNYIQRGYKKPNLQKNIFHTNPLNDNGKIIQKYFNEYIKNKKKPVTIKEKNFYYLYKLQDCIRTQKYKDKKNLQMLLNSTNFNKSKDIKNLNNNYNLSNIFLKKFFHNINHIQKKPCLSEGENIPENNLDISNNDKNSNNIYNFEHDENFMKLNEYEQNNIRELIKNREENKKYKIFIENVLKDKKYFNIIDNDSIELDKKPEIKTMNSIKNDNNKKLMKLKRKIDNKNICNKLDDSSNSSENDDFINEIDKANHKKKLSTIANPLQLSNYRLYNYPQVKNFISISRNTIFGKMKDSEINPEKKVYFSADQEEKDEQKNQKNTKRKVNKNRKTELLRENKFFKKYNFSSRNLINNKMSKLAKEKSLNFLFEKIKTGEIPDQKALNEYKKYFFMNKNMSESDLNDFINREYGPQDFYNLVNSADTIIKKANFENKLKKYYVKNGRFEEKKNLFDEEKKQDNYISHLLEYFILAKYGIYNLYQFQK